MVKVVIVAMLLLVANPVIAETLMWQYPAGSQQEINTYVWRYYPNGAKKGIVLKNVVCKETEMPFVFNCMVTPPKVVGWIRVTATHPKLGESYQSDAIYVSPKR